MTDDDDAISLDRLFEIWRRSFFITHSAPTYRPANHFLRLWFVGPREIPSGETFFGICGLGPGKLDLDSGKLGLGQLASGPIKLCDGKTIARRTVLVPRIGLGLVGALK
ncbi:hypothetical protein [Bradyrhizobium sp. LMG 9283]|uniref:hypothetical protein n=1 Tax=Bradyrhizobium sp. LMG 9283 TaxID=592064 RepID=UPI00388F4A40